MKLKAKKIIKVILYILPLVMGICGFYIMEGEPFLDSVFNSILFYILCYTNHPANILIEIARWLAPAMTASWVLLLFDTLREKIYHLYLLRTRKSVAVYGPEEEKDSIISEIKKYAISGKEEFIPASKYILMGKEEENFTFYNSNREKLKNSMVYLKSSSLPAEAICDSGLRLFCSEETAARMFWKENFLYPVSVTLNHEMEIVLIGFDKLGEELLYFGLQNNIFSPDQKISYHIFGDGTRFQAIHSEMASISDEVVFYDEPWYLHCDLIEKAEMVVVLTQELQTGIVHDLLMSTRREYIHVFADNAEMIEMLDGKERLQIFDWKAQAHRVDRIMSDELFKRAKRINLRYAHLYSGVAENEKNMEKEWKVLDTFTRYSNVSSADYHEVRMKMMEADGISKSNRLTEEELEFYAELEHIRWSRYHYLNNWKYGVPENGKNKDKKLRIHKDLIPYHQLTDGDKEKDRENIRILHSIE